MRLHRGGTDSWVGWRLAWRHWERVEGASERSGPHQRGGDLRVLSAPSHGWCSPRWGWDLLAFSLAGRFLAGARLQEPFASPQAGWGGKRPVSGPGPQPASSLPQASADPASPGRAAPWGGSPSCPGNWPSPGALREHRPPLRPRTLRAPTCGPVEQEPCLFPPHPPGASPSP